MGPEGAAPTGHSTSERARAGRAGPREVRIGIVQMGMVADREKNLDKAVRMVGEAARKGAQVVCLPELFNSLYFPRLEDARPSAEPIPGPTSRALSRAARENGVVLVGGSIYERDEGAFYNTSTIFDEDGSLLGRYRKVHIPNDPGFYEQSYFAPGGEYSVFETRHCRLGSLICFDQWYPEPARVERLLGAEVLFYPTAIGWVRGVDPAEGDWHEAWEVVQRGHAISNGLLVCAANRVGEEGELSFWGRSFVCDQFGTVLARAGEAEEVLVVKCDLELGREVEEGWGFLRNRRPRTYGRLTE